MLGFMMKLSTSFSKSITSSGSESEHEADFSLPFSFIQERLLLCGFSATTERAAAVVVGAEAAGVVADAEAEAEATGSVSEAEAERGDHARPRAPRGAGKVQEVHRARREEPLGRHRRGMFDEYLN